VSKKKTTFGISFPDERLLLAAKEKAKELGISLSAYINQLIRKDLHLRNVFNPKDTGALLAAEDQAPYSTTPRLDSVKRDFPATPPVAPKPKPSGHKKDTA